MRLRSLAAAAALHAVCAGGGLAARTSAAPDPRPTVTPRFFFAGDGRLRLHHAHFNTTLDVRYRRADGTYDQSALAEIRHFFRSREDGREGDISLRLIELLAFVQYRFHPPQMVLLSAYRSPEFNADLRAGGAKAAKASLHSEGLAADVTCPGSNLVRLWHDLRALGTGGVGYYKRGQFLHVDTGKARFWEETTSRVDEDLSAGNARVFLRTDYDRYDTIAGAVVSVHSVTAFPLAIATQAQLVGPEHTVPLRLEAADGVAAGADCVTIPDYAAAYRLRVVQSAAVPLAGQFHIVLAPCEPRVERTPSTIDGNTIELSGR